MTSNSLQLDKTTQPRHRAGRFLSPDNQAFLLALLLFAATLTLYRQVHLHQFIDDYDDGPYVTANLHVKYGLDWSTVKWAFGTYEAGVWNPLSRLSHALDCQLFGLNTARHHEMNALLHALNAVLLFWVLRRSTGYSGRSFMVAALFALHPINVESVAWIAERKNLLSMLFFLLTLAAYRWYAREPRVGRYLLVALLFALGLMAKPQVITLPFVLLLWDYWPLGRMFAQARGAPANAAAAEIPARSFAWLVLEKLPLLLLSAAGSVVTIQAEAAGGAMTGVRNLHPLYVRLENAIVCYARYVGNAFWPSHLAAFYPYPGSSLTAGQVATASLLLLAITALVTVARRRARYLLVGWLWFLGTLVPMIGLVQVGSHAMADSYAYLSFVGLFIMVCWGVSDWFERRHLSPVWLAGPSLAALLLLAAVSHRQISYWQDSVSLWSHAVQVTSNNYEAEDKLGMALLTEGLQEESAPHFQRAAVIAPDDPLTNQHVGYIEQQQGNLQGALEHYQKVLRLTQDDIEHYAGLRDNTLTNMVIIYRSLGDFGRAAEYEEAVENQRRKYLHR